jgi:hypothetical protein
MYHILDVSEYFLVLSLNLFLHLFSTNYKLCLKYSLHSGLKCSKGCFIHDDVNFKLLHIREHIISDLYQYVISWLGWRKPDVSIVKLLFYSFPIAIGHGKSMH